MASFSSGKWISKGLSIDQKPDCIEEKKRIIEKGGRVEAFIGFYIIFYYNFYSFNIKMIMEIQLALLESG